MIIYIITLSITDIIVKITHGKTTKNRLISCKIN